jgi:hypothetical protein
MQAITGPLLPNAVAWLFYLQQKTWVLVGRACGGWSLSLVIRGRECTFVSRFLAFGPLHAFQVIASLYHSTVILLNFTSSHPHLLLLTLLTAAVVSYASAGSGMANIKQH